MAFTERISAACGRKKAELVLKHAKIVNVFTESIEDGDVAVEDGVIVEDAPPEEFFEHPKNDRIRQFIRKVEER